MLPDKTMKLGDLMYGHDGKFMCHLSGRFNPEKYRNSPRIQICEMICGCWVVADGNNRIGLILRRNPEATISDIPDYLLSTARYGEWDSETMDWWNPCARSFREVMKKPPKKQLAYVTTIHGMIERDNDGGFYACVINIGNRQSVSSHGSSIDETRLLLIKEIEAMIGITDINLVLTSLNQLVDHQCSNVY